LESESVDINPKKPAQGDRHEAQKPE
jgi:hypothetical protein